MLRNTIINVYLLFFSEFCFAISFVLLAAIIKDSVATRNERLKPHIYIKDASGVRLTRKLEPLYYNLTLIPIFDDFSFIGEESILVTANDMVATITLHIDELTINEDSIYVVDMQNGKNLTLESLEYNPEYQFFIIHVTTNMTTGSQYLIHIDFNGTLVHDDWTGFYRTSYVINGETR